MKTIDADEVKGKGAVKAKNAKTDVVDRVEPIEVITVVEDELLKFAAYDNIRTICNKYMLSGMNEKDIREQIGAIVLSEFRRHLENTFTHKFLEKKDKHSNNKITLSDAETRVAVRRAFNRVKDKNRDWNEVLHFSID